MYEGYDHHVGNDYIVAKFAIFFNGVPVDGYEQRILGFNYDAIRVFLRDPSREKANRFADNFKKMKLLIQVNGLEQYALIYYRDIQKFYRNGNLRYCEIIKNIC